MQLSKHRIGPENSPEEEPKNQVMPVTRPSRPSPALFLLAGITIALCFYQTDGFSIRDWDEATHVLAVQNMHHYGHWLTPMVEGQAYFNKPPFKMWLSAASLSLLGESNFSWRFIDGLAGLGTTLLIFFFSQSLFKNRFAAFVGSLALLGCYGFLFEHCVRMGVQDSLLVFLSTAAIYCGWKAFKFLPSHERSSSALAWTVACGIFCGFGILTKSLPGLFPFGVLGLSAVLSGRIFSIKTLLYLALAMAIAVSIASSYMLPHCLISANACETFFGFEVWDRVTQGYHNTDNPWLYWELLFDKNYALHPALLIAGLVAMLSLAIRSLDPRALLVISWVCVPPVILSFSASRLPWYIAPIYPGISLLVAGLVSELQILQRSRSALISTTALLGVLVVLFGVFGAIYNTSSSVLKPKRRIAFDELHESLRNADFSLEQKNPLQAARRELPYLRAIEAQQYKSSFSTGKHPRLNRLILTRKSELADLLSTEIPNGYFYLPPFAERKTPMVAMLYAEPVVPKGFSKTKLLFDLGSPKAPIAFGWEPAGSFGKLRIRNSTSNKAALLLETDWMFASRPTELFINLSVRNANSSNSRLKLFLNNRQLSSLPSTTNKLATLSTALPKNSFEKGTNLLVLEAPKGTKLMANWISLQLR